RWRGRRTRWPAGPSCRGRSQRPSGTYSTAPGWNIRALAGDGLELGHLDRAEQPTDLARLEPAGADLERRSRTGGDGRLEHLVDRPLLQPAREERRQQHVARPDRGEWVDRRGAHAET